MSDRAPSGYADRPLVKPPVWTWEIPVYFFVGGVAGMSLLIAAVAGLARMSDGAPALDPLVRKCVWVACAGAVISPMLLISDLGRPMRFLNMLSRFNVRSPMSMGVWILVGFSGVSGLLLIAVNGTIVDLPVVAPFAGALGPLMTTLLICGGLFGALLATYTGVLLGVSTIPAWHQNRRRLPVHFGLASLGSAASVLLLFGSSDPVLVRLLWIAIAGEAGIALLSIDRSAVARENAAVPQWTRLPPILMTVASAVPLVLGLPVLAAISFPMGSLLSRFAWIKVGRLSAMTSGSSQRD